MDYQGKAVDLSEDFTVAASNVITTLAFGKEVSICPSPSLLNLSVVVIHRKISS